MSKTPEQWIVSWTLRRHIGNAKIVNYVVNPWTNLYEKQIDELKESFFDVNKSISFSTKKEAFDFLDTFPKELPSNIEIIGTKICSEPGGEVFLLGDRKVEHCQSFDNYAKND